MWMGCAIHLLVWEICTFCQRFLRSDLFMPGFVVLWAIETLEKCRLSMENERAVFVGSCLSGIL